MSGDIFRMAPWKNGVRQIWHACIGCGKERWVAYVVSTGQPRDPKCKSCSLKGRIFSIEHRQKIGLSRLGEKHPQWKGGRRIINGGYVEVYLYPDDFFYPMVKQDYHVLEHRLVMAKHLGRCLHSWEIVHHKNGIKDDNRIENLQLVSDDRHKQITLLGNRIKHLEKRVTLLEAENVLLKTAQEVARRQ